MKITDEFFEDLRRLINRAPRARLKVARAYAQVTRMTSQMPDPNQLPRGGATESTEDKLIRYIETKDACEELLKIKTDMQDALRPFINALESPLERTSMEMRYLEDRSSSDVADRLFYSKQHVDRILRKAEKSIIQAANGGMK